MTSRRAYLADPQRDFDFEFGSWTVALRRLQTPLTGSDVWLDYVGTSTVRPVWGGRGNLGELDVQSGSDRLQGISLRLYEPTKRLWNVYWANANRGQVEDPMVGRFLDGEGRFFNEETYRGTPVQVRFTFSDLTAASFRFEQAFSADRGSTWEANWIASFDRKTEDEIEGAPTSVAVSRCLSHVDSST
jgi:hypothetical protein